MFNRGSAIAGYAAQNRIMGETNLVSHLLFPLTGLNRASAPLSSLVSPSLKILSKGSPASLLSLLSSLGDISSPPQAYSNIPQSRLLSLLFSTLFSGEPIPERQKNGERRGRYFMRRHEITWRWGRSEGWRGAFEHSQGFFDV